MHRYFIDVFVVGIVVVLTENARRKTFQSLARVGGARCSSVVRAFAHGAMGRRIDPSWWTHWAITRFSQCPMTGVVCVILSVR